MREEINELDNWSLPSFHYNVKTLHGKMESFSGFRLRAIHMEDWSSPLPPPHLHTNKVEGKLKAPFGKTISFGPAICPVPKCVHMSWGSLPFQAEVLVLSFIYPVGIETAFFLFSVKGDFSLIKKENKIFLIYKEIQTWDRVQSHV